MYMLLLIRGSGFYLTRKTNTFIIFVSLLVSNSYFLSFYFICLFTNEVEIGKVEKQD